MAENETANGSACRCRQAETYEIHLQIDFSNSVEVLIVEDDTIYYWNISIGDYNLCIGQSGLRRDVGV